MSLPLLLASTSPRRSALLREAGVAFEVLDPGVSDASEALLLEGAQARGQSAAACVEELAIAKLLAGLRQARAGQPVLAADTTVAHGDAALGKAPDRRAAAKMLRRLRGTRHAVHTGVAVLDARGRLQRGVATTEVEFRDFSEAELETFLASEAWRGKAGAYGVQDPESAPLVAAVEGSRSNVIGLPLELVREFLPDLFRSAKAGDA